ncbi:hypothetical protein ACT29H_01755 [Thermophagus sp. OGC60D27]|uniref:hypothetical protein n=1 Tax=Thermophagus sp. OGC60D27 TaxID=3458415 RepID=UPI0040376687
MKKTFKTILIGILVLPVIGGAILFVTMSDTEKASMEIDSIVNKIQDVTSFSELDKLISEVDSIVSLYPELTPYADSVVFKQRPNWENKILEKQKSILAIRAFNVAQEAVKKRLRSPSTANFASFHDNESKSWDEDGIFICQFHVDSQNGFGAMVRTRWQVKLLPVDGNFKVIEVVEY